MVCLFGRYSQPEKGTNCPGPNDMSGGVSNLFTQGSGKLAFRRPTERPAFDQMRLLELNTGSTKAVKKAN